MWGGKFFGQMGGAKCASECPAGCRDTCGVRNAGASLSSGKEETDRNVWHRKHSPPRLMPIRLRLS
ncbi:hypothetical protein GCM10008922_00310 [Faecalicatena contorta]|nr:hypothetical protein [Faecalicatena contorta]